MQALGNGKHKPCVHIDMVAEMSKLGLGSHFPSSVWPPTNAVRELASKLKTLKATGQPNVLIAAEIKKFVAFFALLRGAGRICHVFVRFLPSYCVDHLAVQLDENGLCLVGVSCLDPMFCTCRGAGEKGRGD